MKEKLEEMQRRIDIYKEALKYKVLFKNSSGEWEMSSSHYKTVKDFDCNNIFEDKYTLPQTQIEVEE